jgi:hypothetical protein
MDIEHGSSAMKTASVAIAFLFVVCLALPLAVCGGDGGGAPAAEPSPTATAEEPTAVPTPAATSEAEPTIAPATDKIAFGSERDGNSEIYIMNADGSGQTKLSNNPADDVEPAWSP